MGIVVRACFGSTLVAHPGGCTVGTRKRFFCTVCACTVFPNAFPQTMRGLQRRPVDVLLTSGAFRGKKMGTWCKKGGQNKLGGGVGEIEHHVPRVTPLYLQSACRPGPCFTRNGTLTFERNHTWERDNHLVGHKEVRRRIEMEVAGRVAGIALQGGHKRRAVLQCALPIGPAVVVHAHINGVAAKLVGRDNIKGCCGRKQQRMGTNAVLCSSIRQPPVRQRIRFHEHHISLPVTLYPLTDTPGPGRIAKSALARVLRAEWRKCTSAHKAVISQMHCAPGPAGAVRTQKVVVGPARWHPIRVGYGTGGTTRKRCGKSPPWVAQVVVEQYIGMECAPLEQHIGMKWRRRRCGKQYIGMYTPQRRVYPRSLPKGPIDERACARKMRIFGPASQKSGQGFGRLSLPLLISANRGSAGERGGVASYGHFEAFWRILQAFWHPKLAKNGLKDAPQRRGYTRSLPMGPIDGTHGVRPRKHRKSSKMQGIMPDVVQQWHAEDLTIAQGAVLRVEPRLDYRSSDGHKNTTPRGTSPRRTSRMRYLRTPRDSCTSSRPSSPSWAQMSPRRWGGYEGTPKLDPPIEWAGRGRVGNTSGTRLMGMRISLWEPGASITCFTVPTPPPAQSSCISEHAGRTSEGREGSRGQTCCWSPRASTGNTQRLPILLRWVAFRGAPPPGSAGAPALRRRARACCNVLFFFGLGAAGRNTLADRLSIVYPSTFRIRARVFLPTATGPDCQKEANVSDTVQMEKRHCPRHVTHFRNALLSLLPEVRELTRMLAKGDQAQGLPVYKTCRVGTPDWPAGRGGCGGCGGRLGTRAALGRAAPRADGGVAAPPRAHWRVGRAVTQHRWCGGRHGGRGSVRTSRGARGG
eukprot:gene6462-biopygen7378